MNWLTQSGSMVSAVAELARQVRGTTLQLLEVPDRSWLTWTPTGTSNHILWHAGHALWVQDVLTIEPLTGRTELPSGWAERFGQDSHPRAVAQWPDVTEVNARLEAQVQRIVELLLANAEKIDKQVNTPPSEGSWPLVPGMIHACHDEARHQGEMRLLLKIRSAM